MGIVALVIGAGTAGIIAFALLTIKDLVKYSIRKARSRKNGGAGTGNEAQPSFPQTLKRNLILLPIGCVIVVALALVLPLIFPVK